MAMTAEFCGRELRMVDWMIRFGWCSLVIGMLLCTPLAELLPVELWVRLRQLLSDLPPGSKHLFLRVTSASDTPIDPFKLVGAVLLVLGLLLMTMGYWMRSKH